MKEISVIVNTKLGAIDFDLDTLKSNINQISEKYKGIIVTEDTIAESKKDVAFLRTLKKQVGDKRKAVKNEYLAPLSEFEIKIKDALSVIDEPILELTSQMELYEIKRKADKKLEIEKLYNSIIDDMSEYVPLNKIYQASWDNKTTSLKSIENEIVSCVDSAHMAVETIKNMNSDAVDQALNSYKQDLSLPNAISLINKYELNKQQVLQREKERAEREEQEKAKREEARLIAEEEEKERFEREKKLAEEKAFLEFEEAAVVDEAPAFEEVPTFTEPKKVVNIELNVTWSQYDDFKSYLKSKNIDFKEI